MFVQQIKQIDSLSYRNRRFTQHAKLLAQFSGIFRPDAAHDHARTVDGYDADALSLFGIDPANVTDDYALYNADEETFSYSFADDASFIVYLGSARRGANRSGFITVVKNSGRRGGAGRWPE